MRHKLQSEQLNIVVSTKLSVRQKGSVNKNQTEIRFIGKVAY